MTSMLHFTPQMCSMLARHDWGFSADSTIIIDIIAFQTGFEEFAFGKWYCTCSFLLVQWMCDLFHVCDLFHT